jgi:hypothetical protein
MSIQLYHYTTSEGADGIESSQTIYRSTDGGPDAVYGAGVYLTDLDPTTNPKTIAKYIYDGDGFWKTKMDNVSNVVVIKLKKEEVKEVDSSRHIWLYPDKNLDLSQYHWRVIKNIQEFIRKMKEAVKNMNQ